jgi:Arc/MetJ-type ribon-helix-helix transcriptional regulator
MLLRIELTEEQERRVRALIERGEYGSVEEVLEAGLAAVE